MARNRYVGEIRISKRTVQIGYEVYPLANISRVRSVELIPGGKRATYYPLREIAILALLAIPVAAAFNAVLPEAALTPDDEERVRQIATGVAVVAGGRLAYLFCLLFYRIVLRPRRYMLVIETAGTQYTAMSGTAYDEIERIKGEIVDAIENPPQQERIVQVRGDLVMGDKIGRDKYQQSGSGNHINAGR
ncbi:DUF6232 family protein [Streptomyces sp. NPDC015127]|uniref:DUF6232 family protein n=1 Tax=Streptomyces sp. NPDC015127 TaxID=3364939 RepID=UPI0036FAD3D9